MLVDAVTLLVRGGNGGNGAATLRRTGQTAFGGPDGGNGGNGGSVFVKGSNNVSDLRQFRYKKKVVAADGTAGKAKNLFGRNAADTVIELPLGTTITDLDSGRTIEIQDTVTLIRIARGGRGGRGNYQFKSATNQTPRYAEPGGKGEERRLQLDLRIIAQVGLVGLPNAGKSSLLSVLTNATPEVANYPFTTLEPNIGMLGKYAVADIPGLIAGAAQGKGLGIKFLKHIEKTKILLHCIDTSGSDPEGAYETVRGEFSGFSQTLLEKPEVIVLTKTDLADAETVERVKSVFALRGLPVVTCSVYDDDSIASLKQTILSLVR